MPIDVIEYYWPPMPPGHKESPERPKAGDTIQRIVDAVHKHIGGTVVQGAICVIQLENALNVSPCFISVRDTDKWVRRISLTCAMDDGFTDVWEFPHQRPPKEIAEAVADVLENSSSLPKNGYFIG